MQNPLEKAANIREMRPALPISFLLGRRLAKAIAHAKAIVFAKLSVWIKS